MLVSRILDWGLRRIEQLLAPNPGVVWHSFTEKRVPILVVALLGISLVQSVYGTVCGGETESTCGLWPVPAMSSMAPMAEADPAPATAGGKKEGEPVNNPVNFRLTMTPNEFGETPSPIGVPTYNELMNSVHVPHDLCQGLGTPSGLN